jgi:hypothetical protein
VPATRDETFAELPIAPLTVAQAEQIYTAIQIGRPVRPGLVARLWRHAQFAERQR